MLANTTPHTLNTPWEGIMNLSVAPTNDYACENRPHLGLSQKRNAPLVRPQISEAERATGGGLEESKDPMKNGTCDSDGGAVTTGCIPVINLPRGGGT